MGSKERVVYILKILVLICILAWLLYTDEENYVDSYNAKIEALEQKVDSLHSINDDLYRENSLILDQILSDIRDKTNISRDRILSNAKALIVQERLKGWQLESFKESYKNKVENGISLFKKELIK